MADTQILILLLYAVILVVVGVLPGRIRQERESYLISERALSGASSGFTIAASKIGGGLLVTYSTLFFAYGPQALWLFVGFAIGYAGFYVFATRVLFKESSTLHYYTMADFFEKHYGKAVGVVVGLLSVATMVGWILTNLIAGAALLSKLSGWSTAFTTSAMAVVIASYLLVRGFHAVVRTDVIQYVSLLVIAALVLLSLARIDPTSAVPAAAAAFNRMPVVQTLSLVFLGIMFPMGSAELWQRVYATGGRRQFRVAIIFASASFFVLGGILSYLCLRLSQISGSDVAAHLGLAMGVADVVKGIPGVGELLATLWFLAFAAAILSSADTFMYTAAASLVQDVLQRLGAVSEAQVVSAIRVSIGVMAALGIIGAIGFGNVLTVTFFFVGLTLVLGAMALAGWIRPTIRPWGLVLAAFLGTAAVVLHSLFNPITITTAMYGLVGAAAPLLVALLVSWRNRTPNDAVV